MALHGIPPLKSVSLVAFAILQACSPSPPSEVFEPVGESPEVHSSDSGCVPLEANYPGIAPEMTRDTNPQFWDGQLVLSGASADFSAVTQDAGFALSTVDSIDFDSYEGLQLPAAWSGLAIQLLSIGDGTAVLDVVARLNGIAQSTGVLVFAEPNYVTSPAGHGSFGSPEGVLGGSPGSPWAQWALGEASGIHLLTGTDPGSRTVDPSESPVTVAVFDSSPFAEAGLWTINRADLSFDLCVSLPATPYMDQTMGVQDAAARSNNPPIYLDGMVEPKVEHGLFVAGLIAQVNPNTDLQLIRVLDERSVGDSYTLAKAIVGTLARQPRPAVMNLSLGIHLDGGIAAVVSSFDQLVGTFQDRLGLPIMDPANRASVMSTRLVILAAQASQDPVVVVASAGNESDGNLVMPMQYPAIWEDVLGVGASNIDRKRSCFSNESDVLAPGGEGGSPCDAIPQACTGEGADCPYAVIGPVTHERSETGYAFWSGTSFSAPLVSGLASLLVGPSLSPTEIAQVIANGGCGVTPAAAPTVVDAAKAISAASACP